MESGHARRLGIATAVVIVGVGAAWLWPRGGDSVGIREGERDSSSPTPPVLATAPADGSASAASGESATPEGPRPPEIRRSPTRVRVSLVLERPDGTTERIRIVGGESLPGPFPTEEVVAFVHGGERFSIATDDARAALPSLWVSMPTDVPTELTVPLPRRDDPRLQALELRVVESGSGRSLDDAVLEWAPVTGFPARVPADADGRIPLRYPGSRWTELDAMRAIWSGLGAVHAPGHGSALGYADTFDVVRLRTIDVDDLTQVLEEPALTISLEPIEADRVERTLRVTDGRGRSVPGTFVVTSDVVHEAEARQALQELGSAVGPWHLGRTHRRTDDHGLFGLGLRRDGAAVLEIVVEGAPFAAWTLPESGLTPGVASSVRVPDRADVTVVFEDAREPEVEVSLHPIRGLLGAAASLPDYVGSRVPVGLPFEGPYDALPEFVAGSTSLRWGRVASGDPPTITLPVAVGRGITLYVGTRRLDVKPTAPGPMRMVVRIEDLPEVDPMTGEPK
jgi:hypothetical protein